MCKLVRIKGKKTSLRRARTVYECLRRGRTVYESQIVNHSAYTPGRMGHILGRNGYYRTKKKKSLHGSIQVCLLNLQVGMGNFIQKEERFVEESTTFRSKNC